MPRYFNFIKYATTFHPDIKRWKRRKAETDEYIQKYPKTFRMATRVYSDAVRAFKGEYDAIFQIGSLFGPAENPHGVPYFSYHDSTVATAYAMWKKWMPPDFDRYRDEWYKLEEKMFASMSAVMTYSGFVKDSVVKDYNISPERVTVVGSSLKLPEEYEIDWDMRKTGVLFVTTDFERKGGYELLEIFEKVVREVPGASLTVAGTVPDAVSGMNRPWLRTPGAMSRERLIEEYGRASLLVHPARYDPFPSVILEAANFELPCVGSAICGIPEMISDGETGFLVAPGDIDVFTERIVRLLRDRGEMIEMGKNAKKFVREKFHPSTVAGNMKKVMDSFLVTDGRMPERRAVR
jgi:glycosyltransferase involved in cell wall biosynthesis